MGWGSRCSEEVEGRAPGAEIDRAWPDDGLRHPHDNWLGDAEVVLLQRLHQVNRHLDQDQLAEEARVRIRGRFQSMAVCRQGKSLAQEQNRAKGSAGPHVGPCSHEHSVNWPLSGT